MLKKTAPRKKADSDIPNVAECICLGVIISAWGVRGDVKAISFTERPENIKNYGTLCDQQNHFLTLTACRLLKGHEVCLNFDGITNRQMAENLKGRYLYTQRKNLPETAEDEFYHADLIGLNVRDGKGAFYGHIAAVHNFGSGDLLEITPAGKSSSFFVPFSFQSVHEVDIASGFVIITPPDEREQT